LIVIISLHKVALKSMLMDLLPILKLPSRMCMLSVFSFLELKIIRTLEGTVLHQLIKCSIIFQPVYGGRSHSSSYIKQKESESSSSS
jgi:hypothetical protein